MVTIKRLLKLYQLSVETKERYLVYPYENSNVMVLKDNGDECKNPNVPLVAEVGSISRLLTLDDRVILLSGGSSLGRITNLTLIL